jgi:iron complex transport system ATP-binding protein
MPALSVSGLSVRLGKRLVLDEVSLALEPGTCTAVIGPNGSGKTTLLRAVLGLIRWQSGVGRCGQTDLASMTARDRARAIAYVPQRSRLQASMSVTNVVAMGRYAHQGGLSRLSRADAAAIDAAMQECDCAVLADRHFDRLSCGEQQRVLLARALATQASIIVLDEPTAALDIRHALSLLALLRRLASAGRSLAVVLHQIEEARCCADRAVLLDGGRVALDAATDKVISSAEFRTAYGVAPIANSALGFRLESP